MAKKSELQTVATLAEPHLGEVRSRGANTSQKDDV